MANIKITQLPTATTIDDNDLIAVVTGMDGTPTTEHITKFDFAASIASSPLATNPVENTYADIASMLADQANQTTNFFQFVLDATADPNITIGSAYYEKLASTTATLSLDYRLLSQSEVEVIESSQAYKTFTIEAIQDDATPLTTVAGGRISFEYSGANVTAIFFNKEYTTAIAKFYGSDVNIRFYNRTTKSYQRESIATAAWTTVNTDYSRGAVTGANIQIADLTLSDSIEFSIVQSSGGGAAAEWGAITGTLSSQTDLQAALDAKQGDITLTTVGTAGAATLVGDTLNIPDYDTTGVTDHSALSNLDYASAGHTGFEPAKGVDDNYVTDANLVVINNTSGTNTGDQDLSGLQGDITLTTTGTSGAATFIADTLNIPNYASSGGATSTVTADTGTAISLANNVGNFCNMASANTNTTFTVTGAVAGGFARVLINTATQPTVTGGTLENGADWIASSNMYLDVYYDGATTKYYFISIASVSETEDRLEENATTTGTYNLDYALYECWNLTLTGATTLTESNLPTSGTNSKVILLNVTGDFALTYPANWSTNIIGTYLGTATNTIVIWYVKSAIYKVQISQPD